MMRRTVLLFAAVTLWAGTASAQATQADGSSKLETEGHFILEADHLVSFFWYDSVLFVPDAGGQDHQQQIGGALLGSPLRQTFNDSPRLGFDYTLRTRFTIGGMVAVEDSSISDSSTTNNAPVPSGLSVTSQPTHFIFGIAVRAGYLLPLHPNVSLWFRGGFSVWAANYVESTSGTTSVGGISVTAGATTTQNPVVFMFDPDVLAVFKLAPHFALTAGLQADVSLVGASPIQVNAGSFSARSLSNDHVAFTGGMLGYF